MHSQAKIWYLKNLEIFDRLSDSERDAIISHTTGKEIKRGDVLYFQGSADENIYLLKSGVVKLAKLTPAGNELILDIFGHGTVFGEATGDGLIEKDETAVAIEDGYICSINRADFERITSKVPELALKIVKLGGMNSRRIENKLLNLLYRTVEQRLAVTLLKLAEDFGEPDDAGQLINIKLTHKDYADLVASTRETVTATFKKLKQRGIIDHKGRCVLIRDMAGIKALAD